MEILKRRCVMGLLLVSLSVSACTTGEWPPRRVYSHSAVLLQREQLEEKAKYALKSLERAHNEQDAHGFFEWVSDDFSGGTDFRFNLNDAFRHANSVDLHFFIDHTLIENSKIDLQTHWQKRTVSKTTGKVMASEGQADFVFQDDAEGRMKLIDIRGQSPFA